jgi:hypothetical protein
MKRCLLHAQVTLKDGSTAEVFEHGMSLAIVALRGSVPQQWIADFKATLGGWDSG